MHLLLSKRLENARIILAVIGLIISVYLATYSSLNLPLSCPQGTIINCDKVLASLYATTFGVPNPIFGILFFTSVLASAKMRKALILLLINSVGIGFVIYYIYSEYQIGSICLYCTGVHIVTILLFLISLVEMQGVKELKLF